MERASMNSSDLIPLSVRDDMAWMVLEQGSTVQDTAKSFGVPRHVVSDAVEGFLRDARETA